MFKIIYIYLICIPIIFITLLFRDKQKIINFLLSLRIFIITSFKSFFSVLYSKRKQPALVITDKAKLSKSIAFFTVLKHLTDPTNLNNPGQTQTKFEIYANSTHIPGAVSEKTDPAVEAAREIKKIWVENQSSSSPVMVALKKNKEAVEFFDNASHLLDKYDI